MSDAREIAHALGGAVRNGRGYLARCPVHDDHSPSLSIFDREDGRGVFLKCHAGCDWRDVRDALKDMGLLDGPDPCAASRPRRSTGHAGTRKADPDLACRIKGARRLWAEAKPIQGTVAETYLRHRGIKGDIPPTLRFHPECVYQKGLVLPALIGAVAKWPDATVTGIIRIFLRLDGLGKAGVASPKKMLGDVRGGAVRLGPIGETLTITEGVETGLGVQSELGVTTWAALSAGGLKTLILPALPLASSLTIAADHDGVGIDAAHDLARRAGSEGRDVRIPIPNEPGTDWLDVIAEHGGLCDA